MYWTVQVSGQYENCAVFNKSTNPEDEKQRCVTKENELNDYTEQNANAKLLCLRGP